MPVSEARSETRTRPRATLRQRPSLTARLLAVAVLATHLPLLVVILAFVLTDALSDAALVGLVLLATIGGALSLITVLRIRLRPLDAASRRLRRFLHLGVLEVGGPYPDDELGQLLAELDEVCLRLDGARAEAERAATVDHLTGALTRRATEASLVDLARRVRRRDDVLSIALLDLDHFKTINDRLGHAAGDAALRHTVDVLGRSLRGGCLVGRWGGDELLVAVRGSAAEVAAGLDRSRQAVTDRLGRVLGRRVTISAGVAELGPADSIASCIALADGALYTAKGNGRDCVVDATSGVLQLW